MRGGQRMGVELDVANLVLAVDSTGVVKANAALDDLAVKGEIVGKTWESGAQRAGSASRQMGQAVEQTATDIQRRIDTLVNGKGKSWITDILAVDPQRASVITGTYSILFKQIEDQEKAHAAKMLELQKAEQEALAAQAAQAAARSREQRLAIAPGSPAYIAPVSGNYGIPHGAATQAEAEAESARKAAILSQGELNTALRDYSNLMTGVIFSEEHMAQVQNSLNLLLKEGKIAQEEFNAAQVAFSKASFVNIGVSGATGVAELGQEAEKTEHEVTKLAGGINKTRIAAEGSTVATELLGGNMAQLRRSTSAMVNQLGLLRPLMSPLGLTFIALAASIGAVVAIEEKAELQESRFNASLLLTGGYAGQTIDVVDHLAASMAQGATTIGTAKETLDKLATSGKYTVDQISLIGSTALEMSARTGQSVDSVIKIFDDLANEPVKASVKWNEYYHFLSSATLERIQDLEKEGKVIEAGQAAQEAFATTEKARLASHKEDVGTIVQAWRDAKGAISEYLTLIGDIGKTGLQAQLDPLQAQMAALKRLDQIHAQAAKDSNSGDDVTGVLGAAKYYATSDPTGSRAAREAVLQGQIDALTGQLKQESDAAKKTAEKERVHADALAYLAGAEQDEKTQLAQAKASYQRTLSDPTLSAQQRSQAATRYRQDTHKIETKFDRLNNDHGVSRAEDSLGTAQTSAELSDYSGALQDTLKKNEDALRDYKVSADAFYNEQVTAIQTWQADSIAAIDKREAAIKSDMGTGKEYIAHEKQLTDLEKQRSAVMTQAAKDTQDAAQKKIEAMQREEKEIARYAASVDKEILALKQEARAQEQSAGMGAQQKQRYDDDMKIVLKEAQDEQSIRLKYANDKTVMNKELAIAKEGSRKELAIVAEKYKAMEREDESYANGFNRFIQNTIVEYRNVASQTETILKNGLDTFNQDFIQQIETGKADWKSFVRDIANGIIEMELKAEEAKLLQTLFGDKSQESGGADMAANVASLISAGVQWQAIAIQIGVVATDLEAAAAMALASGGSGGGGYAGGDGGGSSGGMWASVASAVISAYAANGAVFGGGGLHPMARGGYMVTSPTFRAMANGGTAMIGEAGPEGVFPLRRGPDGRLGVVAAGAGGGGSANVHVSIKDYSGGQKPQVKTTQQPDGQKLIEIIIGKAEDRVASSVSNGKVGQAIQSRFGIKQQGARF